jgi:Staphylococcal nuclease homologue
MRILPALIVALFTFTATAHADVLGRASVLDGDTIEVRGERVRLYGIDAPEAQQLCTISGEPYRRGQQAALALADWIGQRTVRCEERTRDRYGRMVAVCWVSDEDVAGWMVGRACVEGGPRLREINHHRRGVDHDRQRQTHHKTIDESIKLMRLRFGL